jgi:hypothetical protein
MDISEAALVFQEIIPFGVSIFLDRLTWKEMPNGGRILFYIKAE